MPKNAIDKRLGLGKQFTHPLLDGFNPLPASHADIMC